MSILASTGVILPAIEGFRIVIDEIMDPCRLRYHYEPIAPPVTAATASAAR